jgi:hypothetical protein
MRNNLKATSVKSTPMSIFAREMLYAGLVFSFFFVGCAHKEIKLVDVKLLRQYEGPYRTNHYDEARNALLDYRKQLKDWQASGMLGLNYDYIYAIVNGRLAVMADSIGDTNSASDFFRQSAYWFNKQRVSLNLPQTNYSKDYIELGIKMVDGTNITWRRELLAPFESSSNSNGVTRKIDP